MPFKLIDIPKRKIKIPKCKEDSRKSLHKTKIMKFESSILHDMKKQSRNKSNIENTLGSFGLNKRTKYAKQQLGKLSLEYRNSVDEGLAHISQFLRQLSLKKPSPEKKEARVDFIKLKDHANSPRRKTLVIEKPVRIAPDPLDIKLLTKRLKTTVHKQNHKNRKNFKRYADFSSRNSLERIIDKFKQKY